MTTQTHLVRKLSLHVELNGDESSGLALQRTLPGLYRHWVTPAIEGVLERFAPPEEYLCFEHLELDAGLLSLERLDRDLAEAVARALEKWIRERILRGRKSPAAISGDGRRISEQQRLNRAFIHFLENGSLPWFFRLPAGRTLEQALLDSWQGRGDSGGFQAVTVAVRRVLVSADVRKRLVRQFSPLLLEPLLSGFAGAGQRVMAGIQAALRDASVPGVAGRDFQRHLWEAVLAAVAVGADVTAAEIAAAAWATLPVTSKGDHALTSLVEHHWLGVTQRSTDTPDRTRPVEPGAPDLAEEGCGASPESGDKRTKRRRPPETEGRKSDDDRPETIGKRPGVENGRTGVSRNAAAMGERPEIDNGASDVRAGRTGTPCPAPELPEGKARETGRRAGQSTGVAAASGQSETHGARPEAGKSRAGVSGKPPEMDAHTDIGEGIYIDQAGLVLLHPFLPRFFEGLGISAAEKLIQPERALCLLHYLATGRAVAPEYELILPKILCNVPLLAPVESHLELTGAEMEEAAALLQAVINHWEALRNTSADGLRGTFLHRPGKISVRNGDWLLQVESKTCDILLERLPWGFSLIRLPWMERKLWVEWA